MKLVKLTGSILRRPASLNFLMTFVGSIAPVFVLLLTVPLYISLIGLERYGVISMLWVFFGYVGLLDLGLSRATTFRLAQSGGNRDSSYYTSYWTSLTLNGALGFILGAVFFTAANVGLSVTQRPNSPLASEIATAVPCISLLFPFVLLSNTFVGRLEAERRFRYLASANLVGSILIQTAPILGVWTFGVSVASATAGLVLARVFMTLALAFPFILERGRVHGGRFSKAEAFVLLKYGGWVSVSNVVSPILVSLDQFVIGYFVGAKGVGYYSVAYSMVTKLLLLPSAITRVLFPNLTAAQPERRAMIASISLGITGWLLFPVVSVAILSLKPFLSLWIGPDFAAQAGPVAQILLVGIWINANAFVPYSALQSQGLARLTAKFHLLELFPFVVILVVFVYHYGIVGAAFAWLLRSLIDCVLLLRASSLMSGAINDLSLPAVVLSLQLLAWLSLEPSLWVTLVLAVAVCVIATFKLISLATKITRYSGRAS